MQFATGQDSYLNEDDQVAIDNRAYQDLFGGQIMIVLFTMDEGATVEQLAAPDNRAAIEAAKAEIVENPAVEAVVSPLDTLEFSERLLGRTPDAPTEDAFDPLNSIAKVTLDGAEDAEAPGSPEFEARAADLAATTERITPFVLDAEANPRTSASSRSSCPSPCWASVSSSPPPKAATTGKAPWAASWSASARCPPRSLPCSCVAAARTGRAFIVSAMTGVVGIGVIATSSLPLLRDLGIIVAMNLAIALAPALVVLPPIMVWAENRGWVTRGIVDPDKLGNKLSDEATPAPDLAGAAD